uniref:Uncharacterized protein n=1 Tax=Sus scrofa TaxID=9823 RepID=A0A8D0NM92_PIG
MGPSPAGLWAPAPPQPSPPLQLCTWALPRPSITAEPGPVVPWGQPVTIVCQGPAGAETFHLQYKENTHKYKDESNTIQISPHQTAARFPIAAVSEDTVRIRVRIPVLPSQLWALE